MTMLLALGDFLSSSGQPPYSDLRIYKFTKRTAFKLFEGKDIPRFAKSTWDRKQNQSLAIRTLRQCCYNQVSPLSLFVYLGESVEVRKVKRLPVYTATQMGFN